MAEKVIIQANFNTNNAEVVKIENDKEYNLYNAKTERLITTIKGSTLKNYIDTNKYEVLNIGKLCKDVFYNPDNSMYNELIINFNGKIIKNNLTKSKIDIESKQDFLDVKINDNNFNLTVKLIKSKANEYAVREGFEYGDRIQVTINNRVKYFNLGLGVKIQQILINSKYVVIYHCIMKNNKMIEDSEEKSTIAI